ncbi:hypothetical protein CC86DRAFT_52608 [Ophiobolus disseminans]|uniref:Uncharacterized protein n=1 Tax=Ophiobolus disseminans TaxID=1469910 RepID=A0A6A6ZU25_9PLEO|nr:hypothetical protein CC86DRAFT_52608 [Ophiobolus disseminans]
MERALPPRRWTVRREGVTFLWDNGAYFDNACLKDGKLHMFAHFESKSGESSTLQSLPTSAAPSFGRTPTPVPPRELSTLSRARNEVDLQPKADQSPVRRNGSTISTAHTQRPANVHTVLDSDLDDFNDTQSLLSSSDSAEQADAEDGDQLILQQLPAHATAAQHAIDFDKTLVTKATRGGYGYKDNYDDIGKVWRFRITHARLIERIYGLPAPTTCERCADKGLTCRVYHPYLKSKRASSGACGECRLSMRTCVMNGSNQRKAGKKRQASNPEPNVPHAKKHRPSVGGKPARDAGGYCPVLTCSRRLDPFSDRPATGGISA